MSELRITLATPEDIPFIVAGNQSMALETEGRGLDPETLTAGVHAVFADSSRGFYVIAREHDRPLGCLLITYEWSDWRNGVFWWIQSVFVHPGGRRRGIYRRMYEFVQASARRHGDVCGYRLYVERDNHVAQQVYAAMGMHKSDYLLFDTDTAP